MEDLKALTLTINYGCKLSLSSLLLEPLSLLFASLSLPVGILSENSILDFPQTELVILSALVPQNAMSEIMWHLRGSRRAGWSDEVIQSVRRMALEVGKKAGCRINKVPELNDVREDEN